MAGGASIYVFERAPARLRKYRGVCSLERTEDEGGIGGEKEEAGGAGGLLRVGGTSLAMNQAACGGSCTCGVTSRDRALGGIHHLGEVQERRTGGREKKEDGQKLSI